MVKKEEFQTVKYYQSTRPRLTGRRLRPPSRSRRQRTVASLLRHSAGDRSPEHRAGRPGAAHTGASKERTPDRGPAPPAASNPRVRPSTAYPPVVDAPPPGPGPRT